MFSRHIHSFSQTLLGLRSFIDLLEPFLRDNTDQVIRKRANDLAPLLAVAKALNPKAFEDAPPLPASIEEKLAKNVKIKRKKGEPISFTFSQKGEWKDEIFASALEEVQAAARRVGLLYRSCLISLISAVECFLGQVVCTYYEQIPDALPDKEKVFSLDDLSLFGSIPDARSFLIEKKATDIFRGSFSDWIAFFKSRLNLSMSFLEPHLNILVEACERRNLLVHNDGIVNSIYLSKVSPELCKNLKKGSELSLTRNYLEERINYFEKYSILICAELWKQIQPKNEKRATALGKIIFEHLKAERWMVAEGLAFFQMGDKKIPEGYRTVAELNNWLCIKRQKGIEAIKKNMEDSDYSAKTLRFQMAYYSLLEKKEEFFKTAKRALKGNEISPEEIEEFPILDEMRGYPAFNSLLPRKKKAKPAVLSAKTKQKKINARNTTIQRIIPLKAKSPLFRPETMEASAEKREDAAG